LHWSAEDGKGKQYGATIAASSVAKNKRGGLQRRSFRSVGSKDESRPVRSAVSYGDDLCLLVGFLLGRGYNLTRIIVALEDQLSLVPKEDFLGAKVQLPDPLLSGKEAGGRN